MRFGRYPAQTLVVVVLLLALVCVCLSEAEPRRCRKKDRQGKGRCAVKKKNKGKDKKEVAPFWRKGPPKDSTVIAREGRSVKLDCAVKGFPKPSFSWNRNERPLSTKKSKKYKQRRGKLFVRSIELRDQASYTCFATNKVGSLNYTFHVAVLENMPLKDIDVVKKPENQTAHVGDTVIFMCKSQDWPRPPVHWIRTTTRQRIIPMVTTGNSSDVLVVHNVTKDHAGVFTCFIGSDSNVKRLDATLTVIDQGESLPFEPKCSLHVRREIMTDYSSGCHTVQPVDIHYCMGSCGRSYYIPQIVSSPTSDNLNQTYNLNPSEEDESSDAKVSRRRR
ncbi:hypothetical protein PoB_004861800 [Plakobranchus ocellatus]|uniref:Ig-like domain-containing protein n=1 Tax=Plakobranchus ocellatus TaxID=259542 RepID=A0AAV4BSG1_9GAST|nr:hypothetical protein PoB_004861800 [Plakobranchus ocellatus]